MLRTATPKGLGLRLPWVPMETAGHAGRARKTPAKRRTRSSCPEIAFPATKIQRASRAANACPSGSSAAGPSPSGRAVSQIDWPDELVVRTGAPEPVGSAEAREAAEAEDADGDSE